MMKIKEIKKLNKYLKEEQVEEIKKEIKNKEDVLKSGNLDEEELGEVLNTLFSILVIEKTLEQQVEGIEEIRSELEAELLEAYQTYDSYIERSKIDAKQKKKRRWILDLLGISENIREKKAGIGMTNKSLNNLKKELDTLKQQKSKENLKDVMNKENRERRKDFCDCIKDRRPPRNHCKECCEKLGREYEGRMPRKKSGTSKIKSERRGDLGGPLNNKKEVHLGKGL